MKGLFLGRALLISNFAVAAITTSGCGVTGANSNNYKVNSSTSSALSSSSSGTTTIDGYTCPASPNIIPNQTNTQGAEDNYTVCTNGTAGQIFITGNTTSSDQICVFPVLSSNNVGTPNLSVQIQCPFASGGNGVTLSYSSINFNAVAIVEAPYAVQMYDCLAYGGTCPNYSYGLLPNASSTSSATTSTSSTASAGG